jgi:hypothetical protein
LAAVVVVCMTATVVAVSGAGTANQGMRFVQSGHLVYNSTLGKVFHIDGGTKSVDGQVPVPGAGTSAQVVQTDKSGFVLADGRTIEFGKSDLEVEDPLPAPSSERPVALEAAGAAYAVYRNAGTIVRFGEHQSVMTADGPLGQPVVTSTGTLWVHGVESGQLCQVGVQADRLSCTAKLPNGHAGVLTLVGDQAVFVDTVAQELRAVGPDGFGRVMALDGLHLTQNSIVAANDVDGRIAILDPQKNLLQLVDASALTDGSAAKTPAKPVVMQLKPGKYDQIASSGAGLALIDSSDGGTVVTLDRDGKQQASRKLPAPSKQAKTKPGDRPGLTRGADSRLYVDGVAGEHVMVVEGNGQVTDVQATGQTGQPTPKPTQPKPSAPVPSQPVEPPASKPPVEPPHATEPPRTAEPPRTNEPPRSGKPANPPKSHKPEKPPASKPTQPVPSKPAPPKPTIPASRPGAPGKVSAQAANASATITWSAAAANGAAITSYGVTWTGGSKTVAGSARRVTVTGLTNGQSYTFTVRAVNRVGAGPGVSSARITLGAAADAPTALSAKASSGAVTLSWRRPNLNGGKLLRYGITQAGNPQNTTATTYRWTGLTNGKRYTFQVRAVTTTSDGRTLIGAAATVSATPGGGGGTGQLRISHGDSVDKTDSNCPKGQSGCAYILIKGTNLQPDTTYAFHAYANGNEIHEGGYELTTDGNGNLTKNKFHNSFVGQQIQVTADGPAGQIRSNTITWPGA